MNVARVSSILTLAAVLLSIIGYSAAERFWLMAIAGVPAATLGWWLTGVKGRRPLGKVLVNALVLAAIGWSAYRVISTGGGQGLTVSIFSQFLAAILLLKLWDKRQARDVAQILTLSVFLAIGSILTDNSLLVGVLLILNVTVITAGVMAFHLAAGLERAGSAGGGQGTRAGAAFATTAALTLAASIVGSIGVWLIMPRGTGLGELGRFGEITGGRRTGFTDRVDLRRSGLISESQRAVMEVAIRDALGESLGADGRLFYLRGAVLDQYQRGAWTARAEPQLELSLGNVQGTRRASIEPAPGPVTIQHVVVRDSTVGPTPVMCLLKPTDIRFDSDTSRVTLAEGALTVAREGRAGRFTYTARSAIPQMPHDREPVVRDTTASFPSEKVRAEAAAVLSRADLLADPALRLPSEDLQACRALERYLQTAFTYTLDPPVGAVESDPVESFLLETRSGHCEYFASAMAAMCRSVGIAAHVVAGYVAAEYYEDEGKYIVRESNAHAWVEAQVAPELWLTFDPTPQGSLRESMHPKDTLLARWTRWMDSMDDLWASSVVSFDEGSRRRILGAELNPTPRIQDWMYSVYTRFRTRGAPGAAKFLISAAAVVLGAVATLVAVLNMARALWSWALARLKRARRAAGNPELARVLAQAGFYRDLLRALSRAGHEKPPWRSPLDHAEILRHQRPALYEPVRAAVDAYYRLRFGGGSLSAAELHQARAAVLQVRHSK